MQIPNDLLALNSNSGIYAIWMVLQHYALNIDIERLKQVTSYQEDGTFSIGLAVGLHELGFKVDFFTDEDPAIADDEKVLYKKAAALGISIRPSISLKEIQNALELGYFAIVYYDTLEGEGQHSLVYEINNQNIKFFDNYSSMPIQRFEQQRKCEGICQQVILIDGSKFSKIYS